MDDQGESVEVRVQGAVEVVEERLKQLQKMTESPVTTPAEESSVNSLQLPIAMTRQVCLLYMCLNTDEKVTVREIVFNGPALSEFIGIVCLACVEVIFM